MGQDDCPVSVTGDLTWVDFGPKHLPASALFIDNHDGVGIIQLGDADFDAIADDRLHTCRESAF